MVAWGLLLERCFACASTNRARYDASSREECPSGHSEPSEHQPQPQPQQLAPKFKLEAKTSVTSSGSLVKHPQESPPQVSSGDMGQTSGEGDDYAASASLATAALSIRAEDARERYTVTKELGRGQLGVVYAATENATGKAFALKTTSKRRAKSDPSFSINVRDEAEILHLVRGHANIVNIHEAFEDSESVTVVMELCRGGNFLDRLLGQASISERLAASAACSVLGALSYCHRLGVVHRDIRPETLMYTEAGPEGSIRLAGFGLATMMPSTRDGLSCSSRPSSLTREELLHDPVGTALYVAPEVFNPHGYGKECDIWSVGVLLYLALGGSPPFTGTNEKQIIHAISYKPVKYDGSSWNEVSVNAKNFLTRMLCKDPHRRASILELLSHPWLNPVRSFTAKLGVQPELQVPRAAVERLHQFAAINCFKKEARRALTAALPIEVAGLLRAFMEMDADGSGVLTLPQLWQAITTQGISLDEAQAQELLHCIGGSGEGVVDYEELLAAAVHHRSLDQDELMFKAFRQLDLDGSGFVTECELRAVLGQQGIQANIQAVLKEVDTDSDGKINYNDCCKYFQRMSQAQGEGLPSGLLQEPPPAGPVPLSSSFSVEASPKSKILLNSYSTRVRTTATSLLAAGPLMSGMLTRAALKKGRAGGKVVHFAEVSIRTRVSKLRTGSDDAGAGAASSSSAQASRQTLRLSSGRLRHGSRGGLSEAANLLRSSFTRRQPGAREVASERARPAAAPAASEQARSAAAKAPGMRDEDADKEQRAGLQTAAAGYARPARDPASIQRELVRDASYRCRLSRKGLRVCAPASKEGSRFAPAASTGSSGLRTSQALGKGQALGQGPEAAAAAAAAAKIATLPTFAPISVLEALPNSTLALTLCADRSMHSCMDLGQSLAPEQPGSARHGHPSLSRSSSASSLVCSRSTSPTSRAHSITAGSPSFSRPCSSAGSGAHLWGPLSKRWPEDGRSRCLSHRDSSRATSKKCFEAIEEEGHHSAKMPLLPPL